VISPIFTEHPTCLTLVGSLVVSRAAMLLGYRLCRDRQVKSEIPCKSYGLSYATSCSLLPLTSLR
jgi:hypothetical protein